MKFLTLFTTVVATLVMIGVSARSQDSDSVTDTNQRFNTQLASLRTQLDKIQNGDPSMTDLKNDADGLGMSVDTLQREMNGMNQTINDDKDQIGSDAASWKNLWSGASAQKSADDAAKLQKDLAALKKLEQDHAAQQKEYDAKWSSYQTVKTKSDAVLAQIKTTTGSQTATVASLKTEMNALDTKLQGMNLESQFSALGIKNLKTSEVLDKLESHFNNTLMQVYLQDEMGKLLGSNALCHAVSSCASGKGHYVPNVQDMQQIFNGSNPKFMRSAPTPGSGSGASSSNRSN